MSEKTEKDFLDPETKEIIEEMEGEGHQFEGISDQKPPETPKEPEKEPEEPKPEEKPEAPKGPPEAPKEPKEPPPERGTRKPPWVLGKELREANDKIAKLENDLASYQSNKPITQEPNAPPPEGPKFDEFVTSLSEKYPEVDKNFIADLAKPLFEATAQKQVIPAEVTAKLKELDEMRSERLTERENAEYAASFQKEVMPELKTRFPDITEDEIEAVKDKLEDHYFDEKYVKLSAKEIFTLVADAVSDVISTHKPTAEPGKPGAAREAKAIDYDNLTEEEFNALPPEEQDKVIDYKASKSRV